jgi:hypothetical protein
MTFGKGFALVLGFIGAVALGVLMAPHIAPDRMAAPATQSAQVNVEHRQAEAQRAPASPRAAARSTTTTATTIRKSSAANVRTVPAAAPALHEVLKPLLNKGADMGVASQEFADAEQFASVAHAARNTEVPFMVLKHRIVDEGKSLEGAIRELKPGLNAAAEAARARAEAKSDILELQS